MPFHLLKDTPEGFSLEVMVGINSQEMNTLAAANKPIPKPVIGRGIVDTGSNITCVASALLGGFGLRSINAGQTQTAAGPLSVSLFEVSLSISDATGVLFAHPNLMVMELVTPLPNVEVLLGRDLLREWLLVLDGSRKHFLLAF